MVWVPIGPSLNLFESYGFHDLGANGGLVFMVGCQKAFWSSWLECQKSYGLYILGGHRTSIYLFISKLIYDLGAKECLVFMAWVPKDIFVCMIWIPIGPSLNLFKSYGLYGLGAQEPLVFMAWVHKDLSPLWPGCTRTFGLYGLDAYRTFFTSIQII